jgi:hypothetical protein
LSFVRGGAICGHCDGDGDAPLGPKISPRVIG